MSVIKKTLRWAAVPFAAVLASAAIHLLGYLYAWINGSAATWYYGGAEVGTISIVTILLFLTRDFFVGFVFVWAGAATAPSGHKSVSVVLATVLSCLCIVSALLVLAGYSSGNWYIWCALAATMIGGIYASCSVVVESKK